MCTNILTTWCWLRRATQDKLGHGENPVPTAVMGHKENQAHQDNLAMTAVPVFQ